MESMSPMPALDEPCVNPSDMFKTESADATSDVASVISSTDSASPSSSSSAPKKKRKSWGQVLPEPTTNLPPRKRAKTDEEKAQRKYERVQRNRQAAHASRMRKQMETEELKTKNDILQRENEIKDAEIQKLRLQLQQLQKTSSPHSPPSSPQLSQWSQFDAPPSLDGSSDDACSPISIPTPSAEDNDLAIDIKQSPAAQSAELSSQQWKGDCKTSTWVMEQSIR